VLLLRFSVWGHSQTGCQHTCTPSPETSHCNESWLLLGYELAKTSWTFSKVMDTADLQWNNNQLETVVEGCRGMWTSWRVITMDLSRLGVMMTMLLMVTLNNASDYQPN